jgi:hypothetical protein
MIIKKYLLSNPSEGLAASKTKRRIRIKDSLLFEGITDVASAGICF